MRILFITRKFPPSVGGMEIYSKEIYDALLDAGNDVRLHRPTTPILGRPSVFRVGIFFLSSCWTLVRQRKSCDAVLLGDFCLSALAVFAKACMPRRVRVVVALHGNDLYFMRKRNALAAIYRWICRFVVWSKALDAAIANSHAIKREALGRGIESVSVVPLATRVGTLREQETPERLRAILFSGRLIQYKGLSWFVTHVWPRLDPTVELLVAGEVWDAAERDCLREDIRIKYLGPIPYDDLANLRARVAVCIMPNIPAATTEQDEGFGLAALEAPAVGTPIVAAACGGLPDAVANEITGFLLPPMDQSAWINCLHDVLAWPPETYTLFGQRAREHIAKHYNWNLVALRTAQILAGSELDDEPGT
jgi:glycosyltransferase involved in cell wall biosynthesis